MADQAKTDWIWKDGAFVPWDEAQLHVMSHVVHYGSSVFEGIRFYETSEGAAVFRLAEHMHRFFDSCRIYRMVPGASCEELVQACFDLIRRNGITEGYLRPIAFRGVGARGLDPTPSPVETYLVCWPWGQYLGAEALAEGVDACVSSWFRPAPNTHPSLAKAGGNYLNSQLMKLEAMANGYSEAIALAPGGTVSEGSAQNVFLVMQGVLQTPALDGTMLGGITRDSVIKLATALGVRVLETTIPREALYTADEIFLTGTASEITPVRSVDRIQIGCGRVGSITRRIQGEYMGVARSIRPDRFGWLEHVDMAVGARS